jgi:hypothetical protein
MMKKFLVLSAIVGLAGIGVGVARQNESPASIVEGAAATSTTVTTLPPAGPSPTTGKAAVKATTSTTTRRINTPTTTVTTARAVATTTTTGDPVEAFLAKPTTTTARTKPTCTLTVEKPTVAPGENQSIRLSSNMPAVSVAIRAGSYSSGWSKTDSSGNASWQFKAPATPGVASITTRFAFITGQMIGSVCSSSFMVSS